MLNLEICIIAALSENRVIGKDGKIPWRIPEDMRHFRELTTPHPIIVGRRTYESFPKRPLPNRVNIVISKTRNFDDPENTWVQTADSLEDAIYAGSVFSDTGKVFIVGGGEVYREAFQWHTIDSISRLYLTLVEGDFEGDTYFPDYSHFSKIVSCEEGQSGEYKYKFIELER